MRTLILSCNTGEGHNSCAQAIQEVYTAHGEVCDIADALQFISKHASRFISDWHTRLYRHAPQLYKAGYQNAENRTTVLREGTTIYRYLTSGAERLRQVITSGGYDAVICTHVFPALAVTEMQKRHALPLVTGFAATDYTCSPSVENTDMDYYFIPASQLKDEFARCGVPREKLVESGMPVKQAFFQPMNKAVAKAALHIPPDHQHIFMMCGSIGCGPMRELADELSIRLTPEQELTIVCGANEDLYEKMQSRFHDPRIHVHGMVRQVPLLMHSADLFLTKPGGLSTSEAAACGVPMVLMDTVAGCETHNLAFFLGCGAAVTASAPRALADLTMALLADPGRLQVMSSAVCCDPKQQVLPAERIYTQLHQPRTQCCPEEQYA